MKNFYTILIVLTMFFFSETFFAKGSRVALLPNGTKFSCNTCHTSGGGTPRNQFGLAVQAITGSNEIAFWSPELAALDSDGDGFSNGQELQDPDGISTGGSFGDPDLVTHPGDASSFPAVTDVDEIVNLPIEFKLNTNYPNPFNPSTNISFSIAQKSNVVLEIYNAIGEKVKTLIDQNYSVGNYSAVWNARDDFGNKVNSGIYIYRLVSDNFVDTKRMVLLK